MGGKTPAVEVVSYITNAGSATVSEVVENTTVSESTIYRVLGELIDADVVSKKPNTSPTVYHFKNGEQTNEVPVPELFNGNRLFRTKANEYTYISDHKRPQFSNTTFRVQNTGRVHVIDSVHIQMANMYDSVDSFITDFEDSMEEPGTWDETDISFPDVVGDSFVAISDDYLLNSKSSDSVKLYEHEDGNQQFKIIIGIRKDRSDYGIQIFDDIYGNFIESYPHESTIPQCKIHDALESFVNQFEEFSDKRIEEVKAWDSDEKKDFRQISLFEGIEQMNITYDEQTGTFNKQGTYNKLIYDCIDALETEDVEGVNGWHENTYSIFSYPKTNYDDGSFTCSYESENEERKINITFNIFEQNISITYPNGESSKSDLTEDGVEEIFSNAKHYMRQNIGLDGEENLTHFHRIGDGTVEKLNAELDIYTDLDLYNAIKYPDSTEYENVNDIYHGDIETLSDEVNDVIDTKT